MSQRLNLLLASLGLGLIAAALAGDWPQLQHDPQHSGRSAVSVVPGYYLQNLVTAIEAWGQANWR